MERLLIEMEEVKRLLQTAVVRRTSEDDLLITNMSPSESPDELEALDSRIKGNEEFRRQMVIVTSPKEV